MLSFEVAIDLVVTPLLAMVGKVSQRIVDLANQQVLAVVVSIDSLVHINYFSDCAAVVLSLSLMSA